MMHKAICTLMDGIDGPQLPYIRHRTVKYRHFAPTDFGTGISCVTSLVCRGTPASTDSRLTSQASGHRRRALRKELFGVDGAIAIGVHVVLERDPTVGVPAVTELRGGLVHVITQDDSIVKLGAGSFDFLSAVP